MDSFIFHHNPALRGKEIKRQNKLYEKREQRRYDLIFKLEDLKAKHDELFPPVLNFEKFERRTYRQQKDAEKKFIEEKESDEYKDKIKKRDIIDREITEINTRLTQMNADETRISGLLRRYSYFLDIIPKNLIQQWRRVYEIKSSRREKLNPSKAESIDIGSGNSSVSASDTIYDKDLIDFSDNGKSKGGKNKRKYTKKTIKRKSRKNKKTIRTIK